MTKGKKYTEVVDGCGPSPVTFHIQKKLAEGNFEGSDPVVDDDDESATTEGEPPRKVEVAVTEKGTVLARRVVYGKKAKVDGYRKFKDPEAAAAALDKNRPEERDAKQQLGKLAEAGQKAPGAIPAARGDV